MRNKNQRKFRSQTSDYIDMEKQTWEESDTLGYITPNHSTQHYDTTVHYSTLQIHHTTATNPNSNCNYTTLFTLHHN